MCIFTNEFYTALSTCHLSSQERHPLTSSYYLWSPLLLWIKSLLVEPSCPLLSKCLAKREIYVFSAGILSSCFPCFQREKNEKRKSTEPLWEVKGPDSFYSLKWFLPSFLWHPLDNDLRSQGYSPLCEVPSSYRLLPLPFITAYRVKTIFIYFLLDGNQNFTQGRNTSKFIRWFPFERNSRFLPQSCSFWPLSWDGY